MSDWDVSTDADELGERARRRRSSLLGVRGPSGENGLASLLLSAGVVGVEPRRFDRTEGDGDAPSALVSSE